MGLEKKFDLYLEWTSFLRSKLCQIILWAYYKNIFLGDWVLYLDNGTKFTYHSDTGLFPLSFSFSGITDFRDMKFLSRYLRKGDFVFDCGAHQGLYSVYLAKLVGNEGRVFAIEPSKRFISYLEKNKQENNLYSIEIFPFAAGNKKEKKTFYENGPFSRLSVQSFDNSSIEVEVICLDELLDRGLRYAFGKIDVEGAELLVLQGLTKMLKEANPPVLQIEITKLVKDYGYSAQELKEFLFDLGYMLYLYSPWSNQLLKRSKPWKSCINSLAIHHKSIEFVIDRLKSKNQEKGL
ncbi:FkbM family methyltransferase [Methylacidiphilum caldifontis]|uniref:FkbM family methyltransferase n=1 Tax=Methylacidiphilum caldifontis TaxID=2795386 RepID=UPI001A8C1D33|nr:FkbM family methyltransferase [Methylacidiphilum caldifontis]QSR87928.1 FkbM family methyltransferase [Methylacidiphilum caldifontis]